MKATRCRKLRAAHLSNKDDGDNSSLPPQSYLSNSSQEVECLKHLDVVASSTIVGCSNTKRPSPPLLLSARNEYGILKPLPTYLRPTLLPHPNLYDLKELLQFVFRHVKHEALEAAARGGQAAEEDENNDNNYNDDDDDKDESTSITIASPNQTLEWRAGDSLDQSTLLASLLLGAGYDAFVVVGTAPEWLRRGRTDSLRIGKDGQVDCDWGVTCSTCRRRDTCSTNTSCSSNRYGWRGMPFTEVPVPNVDDGKAGDEEKGPHAWVMVRPGRRCDVDAGVSDDDDRRDDTGILDAASTIFADPAVGRIWSAEDVSPYASIQTIWNQSNQWINLDPPDEDANNKIPRHIDLEDETRWRPVYGVENDDSPSMLYVPPSWANQIQMPVPYPPTEHRIELYDQAKLELSTSSSSNIDCRKLTRYEDKERVEEEEAIEVFHGRPDHLLERHTRTTQRQTFVEQFSEFHPIGLRQWSEVLGVERTVEFHPRIRADGLVCRRENYAEMMIEETFENRPDRLIRRIVGIETISEGEYAPKGALVLTKADSEEIAVTKFEEHYGDLDEIKAKLEEDGEPTNPIITSRVFRLVEGKISEVKVSHDGVDIVSNTEVIDKEKADANARYVMGSSYQERQEEVKTNSAAKAFIAESDSISSILSISEDVLHLCRVRTNEEQNWLLLLQEDASGNPSVANEVPTESEKGQKISIEEQPCDYLAPFLVGVHDVDNLSREEAERIKEACLEALRNRLLQRAHIMQSKLDEELKIMREEANDLESETSSDARIRVWEKRLEHHEKLSLEKYAMMQQKLNSDIRLQKTMA